MIYNLVRIVLFSGAELAFIVLNFNILPFKKKSIMHFKTFLLSKRECFYKRISVLGQSSIPFSTFPTEGESFIFSCCDVFF